MNYKIDYLTKDTLCELAIEDFKELTSVPEWLSEYAELYNRVTYGSENRPRIADCHLGDETFENIQQFAHLYKAVNSLFK